MVKRHSFFLSLIMKCFIVINSIRDLAIIIRCFFPGCKGDFILGTTSLAAGLTVKGTCSVPLQSLFTGMCTCRSLGHVNRESPSYTCFKGKPQ